MTKATDASPMLNPREAGERGLQVSRPPVSILATPRSRKLRTFSGLQDRSEVTTTTSVTSPALSQSLAVRAAALPEAHMADTPMHGPVNPRSCISSDTGVDGMSSMYFLR